MAVAKKQCKRAMVSNTWANFCHSCINKLRKYYSQLVGVISGYKSCLGSEFVFADRERWQLHAC